MSDQYIGEIRMFAGNYAPESWLMCDGQTLSVSDYAALHSVIGDTYGTGGQNTFKLPDLRGRIPMHKGPSNPLGQSTGTESVELSSAHIPAHAHVVRAFSGEATQTAMPNNLWAASSQLKHYNPAAPDLALATTATGSAGLGHPHDNMMPYAAVSFIIAFEGVFPSSN